MPAVASHNILLVEDEVFARLATADDLMNAGFQVIQAATADEALKLLQSSAKIDLVVTDIVMPETLDGCDLANLILRKLADDKGHHFVRPISRRTGDHPRRRSCSQAIFPPASYWRYASALGHQ